MKKGFVKITQSEGSLMLQVENLSPLRAHEMLTSALEQLEKTYGDQIAKDAEKEANGISKVLKDLANEADSFTDFMKKCEDIINKNKGDESKN